MSKTTTPVKKKKKPKNYYFNIGTEKAIIRYNNTDDARLKNKIYSEHIAYPFDKLAENIIHTFKFYYFDVPSEQVKHEVVSFLVKFQIIYPSARTSNPNIISIIMIYLQITHQTSLYVYFLKLHPCVLV